MKAIAVFLILCSVANAQSARQLITQRAMQRAVLRRYQIANWQEEYWWFGPTIYFYPTFPYRWQNLQIYSFDALNPQNGWSSNYSYQGRVYTR